MSGAMQYCHACGQPLYSIDGGGDIACDCMYTRTAARSEVVKKGGSERMSMSKRMFSDKQYIELHKKLEKAEARVKELEEKIEDAVNCLVCACIADPREICASTMDILEKESE